MVVLEAAYLCLHRAPRHGYPSALPMKVLELSGVRRVVDVGGLEREVVHLRPLASRLARVVYLG